MSVQWTTVAPCKVNLHLTVGPRRADGYHSIASVFALASLSDVLHVEYQPTSDFSVEVQGLGAACPKGKDTLTQALRFWHAHTGKDGLFRITVEKHVPVKAGLGGGSADAGALIRLLERQGLCSREQGKAIARETGSDVPFFEAGCPWAWVTGRGESVEALDGLKPLWGVLVMSSMHKPGTRQAYEALDACTRPEAPGKEEVLKRLEGEPGAFAPLLRNDFASLVQDEADYQSLVETSRRHDGYGVLTGSGSCFCFVSSSEEEAGAFRFELCQKHPGWQVWRALVGGTGRWA